MLFFVIAFTSPSVFAQSVKEIAFNEAQAIPLSAIVNQTAGVEGQKNIEILPGEVVYIDRSVNIGELVINGQLHCKDATAEIKANSIYVNGYFQCGTNQKPFSGKLHLSLKHSALNPKTSTGYRGVVVNNNGNLILNGRMERAGHYRLNRTINPGEQSIELDQSVKGLWNVGDQVVIAPTSYNPNEGEKLTISNIDASGKVVYFSSGVRYRHWGELEKLATARGEVNLDQRAEVANLTRNIVIRADESVVAVSDADIPDGQLGGHVMVNRGGYAAVDSVEFFRLGQAGLMGRYPFHWHLVGDAPGQYIKNSSIHSSFQRCVTVHQTHQTVVDNNVCYNFKGHGFFLEDGNEVNNTISRNVGIGAQFPSLSKVLLNSDHMNANVDRRRFPPVSVFWISNPNNRVTKNIASGSVGTGFWMSFVDEVRRFNSQSGEFDGDLLSRPRTTNTLDFSYNVAHTTLVGHTWDGAPNERPFPAGQNPYKTNNPNNAQDRLLESSHYSPSTTPTFPGLVAYKNLYAGVYFRGDTAIFDNMLLADNGWGAFMAFNQVFRNTTFVGKSKNNSRVEEDYMYNQRRYTEKQAGIVLYDGPWELENVDFLNYSTQKEMRNFDGTNYDMASTPMITIGGTEKLTNIAKNLRFSPEPYHRIYQDVEDGWADKRYSNSVRDLDGSLTGIVGGVLLGENKITHDSSCVKKAESGKETYYGFVVCPANVSTATAWFNSSEMQASVPYLIRRNDGEVSYMKKDWGMLDRIGRFERMHLKAGLLNKPGYEYEVLFSHRSVASGKGLGTVGAQVLAEKINTTTPLLKISGYGANCRLSSGTRYGTLDELRNANQLGYYSNQNDFYIKMKTHKSYTPIRRTVGSLTTESQSDGLGLYCDSPVINYVTGVMDGVTKDASGTYVTGWACDYGKTNEIDIHFYAQNGAKQDMVFSTKANLYSEEGVNFACADTSMQNHRFKVRVPENVLTTYAGAALYGYGISTSGKENSAIGNSGVLRLPGGATTPTPTPTPNPTPNPTPTPTPTPGVTNKITGHIDGITVNGQKAYIGGWACDYGKGVQIDAHVYIGSGRAEEMIGAFKANSNSEDAVANACADSTKAGHRFTYEIPASVLSAKNGKNVYVFGISTSGKENLAIGNSGAFVVPKINATTPAPTPTPTPTPVPTPGVTNKITGWIGEVKTENGKSFITGFACDYGKSNQIDAHIYIGNGKAEEMIGAFKANLANNDSGIDSACADSTRTGHKFNYEIPESVMLQKSGKNIYIFGISTSGKENLPLGNSGVFVVPKKTAAPVVENRIEGWIDGISKANGKTYVTGWTCDYGKSNQIDAHVYIGNGKAEEMIGAFKANSPSEDGVAAACGDSTKAGHRFGYEIPASVMSAKKGKNIYIFGISTSGKENRPIGRSGEEKIP